MWKTYCALIALVAGPLTGCDPSRHTRPDGSAVAVPASPAIEEASTRQRFADAMQLVSDKNWPQATRALQDIIGTPSFGGMPGNLRHQVLVAAAEIELFHGSAALAYTYFERATALPDASVTDWLGRLHAADKADNMAGAIRTLTELVQRWPERSTQLPPRYVFKVVEAAKRSAPDSGLALLQGLYDAHWKLKWDIEPSSAWESLTQLLIEKRRLAQAVDVSLHVTDVPVLIAMRADRHFDAVVAANAAWFDIDAAARRELQTFQAAAERIPESLELQYRVIEALLRQQRYQAALAACDSILVRVRSTNYPERLYSDYAEAYPWLLDERSDLLARIGRWDDAVAQITEASTLREEHGGNVSQLINLAHLYADLGRPREALAALNRITGPTSPYGAMQLEKIRLNAADQVGDTAQVARSMQYLQDHRADQPDAYEDALIYVDQLDRAARLLLERLRDRNQRAQALADVQTYAAPPRTARQADYEARWSVVLARPDVRAAIQRVGRIEAYRLEER